MHVHFLVEADDPNISLLQPMLDAQIFLTAGTEITDPQTCQVLIGGRPSADQLAGCPNLHTLVIPFAGLPVETRSACLARPDLRVFNLHHNAQITAELAMALLFAAAKFVVPHDLRLRKGDWNLRYQSPPQALLLAGKRALVIGYGQVGQRIAAMCQAIGMQVTALQRSQSKSAGAGGIRLEQIQKLREILPESNVLILACPLTAETQGLIGRDELALLPTRGVLVNIARGEVVDQRALYEALVSGHLAAAGLDVWYHYPQCEQARFDTMPADYPFQELEQVVLSPHRGGLVRETEQLRMTHLADLLNRIALGGELPKAVDVIAGY